MKKILALTLALALVASGAFAQTLDEFKTAFVGFTDAFAGSLAVNSTIGNVWSDGYIGGFPHFGVGLFLGSTFTGEGSADPIFTALGQPVPEGLDKSGVPVPAIGATAKVGFLFVPIDLGLKAGVVSPEMAQNLEAAYGVAAEYSNVGFSVRGRVVQEGLLMPELTLGGSANFLKGKVGTSLPAGQSVTYTDAEADVWTVTFADPDLNLGWETTSVDLTAQVSKNFLFIRPYAGLGLTLGKSIVDGGLSSSSPTVVEGATPRTLDDLRAAIIAAGGTPPDFSSSGFLYGTEVTDPNFRVYAGVSLAVLIALDAQVMYVPATKNVGLSLTARLQL